MSPTLTPPDNSMPSNPEPTTPDNTLRASFEQGCRDLNNRLNISLSSFTKRINHAYHEWSKRDAHFASLANLLLEDIGHASGLLKPLPNTHLSDNSQLIETIDRLDTPESKYLARQLRRQKALAYNIGHNVIVKGGGSKRTSIKKQFLQAENEMVKTGEEMPFQDPLPTLRLLLEKERALFPETDRKALLVRIDNLEGPENDCNSIKLQLDIIANSLEPSYTLAEQLGGLQKIFKQLNEETDRLSRLKSEIIRLETETTAEDYDGQALRIDRTKLTMETKLRELEGKLAFEKRVLAQNEAIIKEPFAQHNLLIPAIAAILNEIQFLCGDLVKIKIEEVSEWEIGLAEQGWNKAQTNLPKGSILVGIPPDLVDLAFTFLKEHESFLVAYNQIRTVRKTITGIENEMLAAQELIVEREKDIRMTKYERVDERKQHKTRLEKTAEEAEDEIEQVTANLFEGLETLRTGAGIADPLEKMAPDKFWAEIEKGFGCGTLEGAEKELDAIEPAIHKLDLKIS
jgi:hypothetical protein